MNELGSIMKLLTLHTEWPHPQLRNYLRDALKARFIHDYSSSNWIMNISHVNSSGPLDE